MFASFMLFHIASKGTRSACAGRSRKQATAAGALGQPRPQPNVKHTAVTSSCLQWLLDWSLRGIKSRLQFAPSTARTISKWEQSYKVDLKPTWEAESSTRQSLVHSNVVLWFWCRKWRQMAFPIDTSGGCVREEWNYFQRVLDRSISIC